MLLSPVSILQSARQQHAYGNVAYRILDAAICHLIGMGRQSSVSGMFDASLEVK